MKGFILKRTTCQIKKYVQLVSVHCTSYIYIIFFFAKLCFYGSCAPNLARPSRCKVFFYCVLLCDFRCCNYYYVSRFNKKKKKQQQKNKEKKQQKVQEEIKPKRNEAKRRGRDNGGQLAMKRNETGTAVAHASWFCPLFLFPLCPPLLLFCQPPTPHPHAL